MFIQKKQQLSYFLFLTLFVIFFCMANGLGATFVSIFSYDLTAGTLIYPLTFILSTTVTELWGVRKARQMVIAGFIINACVLCALYLLYQSFWINGIIFVSSFIAFLIGQLTDIYFYQFLRQTFVNRSLFTCSFLCLFVGQALDTLIVNMSVLSIGLHLEMKKAGLVILSNLAYKMLVSCFLLPLIYFFSKIHHKPAKEPLRDFNY